MGIGSFLHKLQIDFERHSLSISYGNLQGVLQTPIDFRRNSSSPYATWSDSISYWFKKDFIHVPMWKWTRSFPDQIPIDVERNSLRFPYANWELCRPISHWFWKEFLKDSIWKLTQSSPDKFPIDFERNSLRISLGNWRGALQTNFPLILKGIP